jgi:hypothetical protein
MTKHEPIPLVPIDLEVTPIPWKDQFALATHPALLEMAAVDGEVDALFYGAYCHVAKILHWVIKLSWDSKHKLPKLPRGQKKAYESLGQLYSLVITLCERCHFLGYGSSYNNAAEWFIDVLSEQRLDSPNADQSKDADIKQMQKENKHLFSDLINPFNPLEEPATYQLVEASLAIREKSDIFLKKIWEPLKAARQAWLKEYRKSTWRSPRRIIKKNADESPILNKDGFPIIEKVIIQVGRRGNQSQKLPPLFLGSVEALPCKDSSLNTFFVENE